MNHESEVGLPVGTLWFCEAAPGVWGCGRGLGARVEFIVLLWLVLVTTLAKKVRGLPSPCLLFGLAPYSAGEKARCALW